MFFQFLRRWPIIRAILLSEARTSLLMVPTSDFLSPRLMFSHVLSLWTPSHAGPRRFAKESIPSQTLSILNGFLAEPERKGQR